MATADTRTRAKGISTSEAKARFCELVRRAEVNGETTLVTRRGRVVAKLAPAGEDARPGNIATDLHGLLADHPDVCDEMDKVYAERHLHKVRYAEV